MLNRLQLFRNVGKFASVSTNIALAPLTAVYAENGQGKTTLTAILRSLGNGDPVAINERHRLAAANPPHVVIDCTGGPPAAMYENGAWNRTFQNLAVFDDDFVDDNVCSGLAVDPEHRQNLHELILGSAGVALSRQIQTIVDRVEQHSRELSAKADAISATIRGQFTVDEFCALAARADIDLAIEEAERTLAAARQQEAIRTGSKFDPISLPDFDAAAIEKVLAQELSTIDAVAAANVATHFMKIGNQGEAWIGDGMRRILNAAGTQPETCPFCAQDLGQSPLLAHYRAYFSEAYASLKTEVRKAQTELARLHLGDVQVGFERAVRQASERRTFWSQFLPRIPDIAIDTATIIAAWSKARNVVGAVLAAKLDAPLEKAVLTADAKQAISDYQGLRKAVENLSAELQKHNAPIAIVKEQAATGNVTALAADVVRLTANKSRQDSIVAAKCVEYLAEKAAKAAAEVERETAKAALDQYRATIFPNYETAINLYLQRFNAGFRLGSVTSTNTRTGPSCTYSVLINNQSIAVSGGGVAVGEPSFRTALSAGDRNTLALAFFFASLDQDPDLATKVVVIDDPITSLDEHRALTTVQELRRLSDRTAQVVVLSHSKPFLCDVWQGTDSDRRAALEIVRDGNGSTLREWDVSRDCITEHDRRHQLLRDYQASSVTNKREVAESLRPVLESFMRVAYPREFPPGTLLGPFRGVCEQRVGSANEILSRADIEDLRDLTDYANRFHHDSNPAHRTAGINDGELLGFVTRTLKFAKQ